VGPTDKEIADDMAIGGLRNAAASVSRLTYSASFSLKLGQSIQDVLRADLEAHRPVDTLDQSWVYMSCKVVGSKKEDKLRPPADAVAAVEAVLIEHTNPPDSSNHTPLTLIKAFLLEAWRVAAKDPDDQVGSWLKEGGPAGIILQPKDPGIFPDVSAPADWMPDDLHCDEHAFKNYQGVEEHEATLKEMTTHLDKGHRSAFNSYNELWEYVGGKPILSKLGLIVKTRNGVESAPTILDTKESDVKRITAKING